MFHVVMELLLACSMELEVLHIGPLLLARKIFTGFNHPIKTPGNIFTHIECVDSINTDVVI